MNLSFTIGMQILKYGLFGMILGEIIVLSQRDKKFKRQMKNKRAYPKIDFLAKELTGINKKFLEALSQYDYQNFSEKLFSFFNINQQELHNLGNDFQDQLKEIAPDIWKQWFSTSDKQ
ncbi:MAG: hypothetical protein GXP45_06460 [bacterium]|nr:hypothetical protein [bacterium]